MHYMQKQLKIWTTEMYIRLNRPKYIVNAAVVEVHKKTKNRK